MSTEVNNAAKETVAQPAKAAVKKPTAKKVVAKKPAARKPVAKKPAAKKPAAKKPAAKKPAAKKPAAKKATAKKPVAKQSAVKGSQELIERVKEAGRDVFLAGLGCYGKAFDLAQAELDSIKEQLEVRRTQANKEYKKLVKRGATVESVAKDKIEAIELPSFDLQNLSDRRRVDAQLKKAKAHIAELRESVGFKSAA